MRFAPFCAVHKEHVRALRLRDLHAVEPRFDIVAGEINVAREHGAQLVRPLAALRGIGGDKRVHGEHVHAVIVRKRTFFFHAVAYPRAVGDVVRTDKPRQIERLARRVQRERAVFRVLAHGLRRRVDNAGPDDVRPDLVGDDEHVVLCAQLRKALDLPALPHAARRVMRRAEHGGMYVVFHDPALHVLKIHAPDAVFVFHERREDHVVAVVAQRAGKAGIGGGVEKNVAALRAEHVQRADDAAEHTVFVADVLAR